MAEKISDLSGAEREAYRRAETEDAGCGQARQAQHKGEEQPAATPRPRQSAEEAAPAVETPAAEPASEATAVAEETAPAPKPKPARAGEKTAPAGNGAAPKPAPERKRPAPAAAPKADAESQAPSQQEMNRREFLTYAWGGALGLLGLQAAVGSFLYMYPRFRAGEFGGKFFIGPESALPDASAAPQPDTTGKFWLSPPKGDPRALYMVCTHLGCLYKWEASNAASSAPVTAPSLRAMAITSKARLLAPSTISRSPTRRDRSSLIQAKRISAIQPDSRRRGLSRHNRRRKSPFESSQRVESTIESAV